MEERPRIKLELTVFDKVIEMAGWFIVLVVWVYTIASYSKLPNTAPLHFNATGEADSFGSKASIIVSPIIMTILYVGIALLNRYPHNFNYPTKITKENAQKQYTMATRWIRYLNLVTALIIGYITLIVIQSAKGKEGELGIWFLPLSLGIVFIPTIYYILKSKKNQIYKL